MPPPFEPRPEAVNEALGLGPLEAVNTYTPGNDFIAACRRMGIGYVLGFCAPTVIEDGEWEIAHYGSPLSPYFVSAEDFRKPAKEGNPAGDVLLSSMELRNPLVCANHWSEGPWCPLNAQAADRWLEPSGEPLPFLQIAEDWLRQTELSDRPLFFHINLQYFFADRCYEHNRRALEWLAEQRDKGRLEIGGLQAWRERLQAAGGLARQTTYWRGEMMGFHVGHRPGCFPDTVVDENLAGQSIWQKPSFLPVRYYDYRPKWDYPAFLPDGTAPASTSFADVSIDVERGEENGEIFRSVVVRIVNRGEGRRLPLLLWDLVEGWEGPFSIDQLPSDWTWTIVPHPSGIGGAVLLEGEAPQGETRIACLVKGGRATARISHKIWDHLVEAQTFHHRGRPYTVLAAQTPEPFVLLAKISPAALSGEPLRVESLIGFNHEENLLRGDTLPLRFDGTRLVCWHRFWGVTADQIELLGVEETRLRLRDDTSRLVVSLSPDLAVGAPGYQLFGNIRDTSRWDRTLAQAAGEAEIERMNTWMGRLRPGAGETVVEVHPGIFLPRGSITKVLGHEFDVVRCDEGYGFRELCVDYPQGWDWGVAAWVQWRQLRLRFDGLGEKPGRHYLHLHAFDPERRNIIQRVHLYDASRTSPRPEESFPVHRAADLCLVEEWTLPQGLDGRWDSRALCTIAIPEECKSWGSLGVWIAPLEKTRLYDWIAEQGAPGLISHVWMTRIDAALSKMDDSLRTRE